MLQTPQGISNIATVTELRSSTSEIVDAAEESGSGVLVVKNNEPYAVLVSFDRFNQLQNGKK